MSLSWIERNAGYTTITYPYDGAKGIIQAVRECAEKFGGNIIRAEYQPYVGTTVVYKANSRKRKLPFKMLEEYATRVERKR